MQTYFDITNGCIYTRIAEEQGAVLFLDEDDTLRRMGVADWAMLIAAENIMPLDHIAVIMREQRLPIGLRAFNHCTVLGYRVTPLALRYETTQFLMTTKAFLQWLLDPAGRRPVRAVPAPEMR